MSLLDEVRNRLNPELWDANEKLHPEVRLEIIHKLTSLIPQYLVKQLWLIGSSASLQYNKYSDIDISVVLKLPREGVPKWHEIFKTHNKREDFLTGTKHPINYFAMPNEPINWGEETTSIYLIEDFDNKIKDSWEKPYVPAEKIRNPEDKYWASINFANLLTKRISGQIGELSKDVKALKSLENNRRAYESKLREIDRDIEELIYEGKKLDSDRKMAYSVGAGTPKYGSKNFIYKSLERSGILHALETLDDFYKRRNISGSE